MAPRDPLDLTTVAVLGGSVDPRTWPATVTLDAIEMLPGDVHDRTGIVPHVDREWMNARWPDVPAFKSDEHGRPLPPDRWGYIQCTLWVIFRGAGLGPVLAMFPAIEFWSNRRGHPRIGTGALLNNWRNWSYWVPEAAGREARVGDTFGFFLTAGDRRRMNVSEVDERTNVLWVRLVESGICPVVDPFTGEAPPPVPVPAPGPIEPPPPPPAPGDVPAPADGLHVRAVVALERQADASEDLVKAIGRLVRAWEA